MLKGIFFGIVLLFVFIGIVSVLYRVMIAFLHPKKSGEYMLVISLNDKIDDPTSLIYAARLRMDLFGEYGKCRIFAVDDGMSESERKKCETLCRNSANIEFCSRDELNTKLTAKQNS